MKTLSQLRAETKDASFCQLTDGAIYWARMDIEFPSIDEALEAFHFVQRDRNFGEWFGSYDWRNHAARRGRQGLRRLMRLLWSSRLLLNSAAFAR